MKITFDESGSNFVEFSLTKSGAVAIILSSRESSNPRKTIVNSVELTQEQFEEVLKDLNLERKEND